MTAPIALRFTPREQWAMIVTTALVVLGFELGVWCNPQWASGIGAVIVVIGVVFAATDLPKLLEQRARNLARVTNALVDQGLINELEEQHKRVLAVHERAALSRHLEVQNANDVEIQASKPRKRFLWVEVGIVCVGTLMNGFGTWLATIIRNSI